MSRLAHEPSCLEFVTSHTHTHKTHTHTHTHTPEAPSARRRSQRITHAHTDTRKHAYTHMHKHTLGEAPSTRRRVKRKLNPASNPFFFPQKKTSQTLDQQSIREDLGFRRFINGVRAKKG